MADKVSRKDLKEPDEFITFTQRAIQWIAEKRVLLIVGAAAVALVVVALYAYRWYTDGKEKEASRDFMEAKKILDAPVVEAGAENQASASRVYSSETEKSKAAIAEFEKVAQKHPGTPTASLALYFAGENNRLLGQYDNAIAQFNQYLSKEGPKSELALFAVEGIGASFEEQGKLPEAKEQYKKIADGLVGNEKDRGMYHLARLEQKKGDPKEAARLYKEILDKYPTTIFQNEISNRLMALPAVVAEKAVAPEKAVQPAKPSP